MTFMDDLQSAKAAPRGGRPCSLCAAFAKMPPEEKEAFDEAMLSKTVSKRAGAEVLKKNGYDVGLRPVEAHYRNGHHLR